MSEAKRPSSVLWAGVVFWFMSLGTLTVHIFLSRRGVVDVPSFIFGALILPAALLWLFQPQSRVTFYVGAVSLGISLIRVVLTARTQYHLRAQFPKVMPQQVVGTLIFAVLLAWLTYRYVFGVSSRRYFKLE
jgi:hypothetical protein